MDPKPGCLSLSPSPWTSLVKLFTLGLFSHYLDINHIQINSTYIHCQAIHYMYINYIVYRKRLIHYIHQKSFMVWDDSQNLIYLQVLQSSPSSPLDQPESAELARWHNCFFFLGFVANGPGGTIVFCFLALLDQVLLFFRRRLHLLHYLLRSPLYDQR